MPLRPVTPGIIFGPPESLSYVQHHALLDELSIHLVVAYSDATTREISYSLRIEWGIGSRFRSFKNSCIGIIMKGALFTCKFDI